MTDRIEPLEIATEGCLPPNFKLPALLLMPIPWRRLAIFGDGSFRQQISLDSFLCLLVFHFLLPV